MNTTTFNGDYRSRVWYTEIDGNQLTTLVGSLGGESPPQSAIGVAVYGDLPFDTYFERVLGMSTF